MTIIDGTDSADFADGGTGSKKVRRALGVPSS
jgi:hypothetical protein